MTDQRQPTPEETRQRKEDEDRDRENREVVALGVEAQNFLKSPLAQFIINSAEEKVVQAKDKLTNVDPTDSVAIVKLQSVVAQFLHYERCLEELVAAGKTAYQFYLEEHQQR